MKRSRWSAFPVLFLVGVGLALVPQGAAGQPADLGCPTGWTQVDFDWNQKTFNPTGTNVYSIGNMTLTMTASDPSNVTTSATCVGGGTDTPCVAPGILGDLGGTSNLLVAMQPGVGAQPVTLTGTFTRTGDSEPAVASLRLVFTDVDCLSGTPDTPDSPCTGSGWVDSLTVTTTGGADPTFQPLQSPLNPLPSFTFTGNPVIGDRSAPNTGASARNGNLQAQFGQNVDDFTLSYRNAGSPASIQGYGFKWISFCEDIGPNEALVTDVSGVALGDETIVEWRTASEVGSVGFHVLRLDPRTSEYVRVNDEMVPALVGSPQGGVYRLSDHGARAGRGYSYKIVEVRTGGAEAAYGPYAVTMKKARSVEPLGDVERLELTRSGFQRTAHPLNGVVRAGEASGLSHSRIEAKASAKRAGMKIGVRGDGLYALTAAEIAGALGSPEAEVRAQIRSRLLQLRNEGAEVAWHPMAESSGILFFGRAPVSPFTADNVYRLDRSQLYRGLQMTVKSFETPSPGATSTVFPDRQRREENKLPVTVLAAQPDSDIFYWEVVTGTATKKFNLALDGVAASSGNATLRVSGRSWFGESLVQVSVNGSVIGQGTTQSAMEFELELPFPQALLSNGENQITVTRIPPPGSENGSFFVGSFDVSYRRVAQAIGDSLLLRSEGAGIATVSGFSAAGIHVLDVTRPDRPEYLVGAAEDSLYGFRTSFPTSGAGRSYLAVSPAGIRKAAWVSGDVPSNLKDSRNEAAYVVITPAAFAGAASQFADYRRTLGSMVVDVEDIYDEFSHGLADPRAVRDFLAHAYRTWRTPPRYVLLMGNGSVDYRNDLGLGDGFLPPLLANVSVGGLFASDSSLADVDGDGIPEIAIGRLPVRTVAEAEGYLAKLRSHETSSGEWADVAILASDTSDGFNYGEQSRSAAALLPATYQRTFTALSEIDLAEARARLIGGINGGAGVVNYLGHGGTDRFSAKGLLTNADVASLTNATKLPVVSALTCVINRYEIPGFSPLGAQLVLAPNGGAIAVWAPTGLSYPASARALNENLFREYHQRGRPVGDAVLTAMRNYGEAGYTTELLRIYSLLGDPAARLPVK